MSQGQPKCSSVLRDLGRQGFKPASRVDCVPRFGGGVSGKLLKTAAYCEMEVLFVRSDRTEPIDDVLWEYHKAGHHGCAELYPRNLTRTYMTSPPPGKVVFHFGPAGKRFFGTGRDRAHDKMLNTKYAWSGYGQPYICSDALFTDEIRIH